VGAGNKNKYTSTARIRQCSRYRVFIGTAASDSGNQANIRAFASGLILITAWGGMKKRLADETVFIGR
jgi:hypothetical protein